MRRLLRTALCVLVILAIAVPWVAWQIDPGMARRATYPAKARLVAWSTRCDAAAPDWLRRLAGELAQRHDSPANQIAFVTPTGEITACVNGWQGLPFFSARLAHDTPMRLASLSKIVSFAALLGPDDAVAREAWLEAQLVQELGLGGPWADPRLEQISIRHLLNHSSGLDRHKSSDPISALDKKPWCPYQPEHLEDLTLDYQPGARQSYHNVDYCLAALAYGHHFGQTLWSELENKWHMSDYGLDYLERRDSPVQYSFMHQDSLLGQGAMGPESIQRLDWHAARAPMGLTGNARGLARFIQEHRDRLQFSQAMRDDGIACDERRVDSCFDGFLNRVREGEKRLWRQRGYLWGMSAHFVLDERGNFIVWLGAGEGRPLQAASVRIDQALLRIDDTPVEGGFADVSGSGFRQGARLHAH